MKQIILIATVFVTQSAQAQQVNKTLDSIVARYLQTKCNDGYFYSRGDIDPKYHIYQFKKFPIAYEIQALTEADKLNKKSDHYKIVFKPTLYREFNLQQKLIATNEYTKSDVTIWEQNAASFYVDAYKMNGLWKISLQQGSWIFPPVSEGPPQCPEIKSMVQDVKK